MHVERDRGQRFVVPDGECLNRQNKLHTLQIGLKLGMKASHVRFIRRIHEIHAFHLLQFGLCHGRLGGLVPKPLHNAAQMRNFALLLNVAFLLHLPVQPLFLRIGRIIAGIPGHLAKLNLIDLIHNVVQKLPVMRNNHHRVPVGTQITFQPFNGLDVEMVGGLVEQQDVRFAQQQPDEGDFGALSS